MKPKFHTSLLLSSITIALYVSPTAQAANWFWDGGIVDIAATGNGASGGTAGNWNTTTLNWDQGNALAHVAWNSANTANFGGTAGAVAVGTGITANGLTFSLTGYSFTGSAITLATGSTITGTGNFTETFTGGLATADNILRFTNTTTTNNFANNTIFNVVSNISGASTSVQINGASTNAPVGFSGSTLSWGGTTTVAANTSVHFLTSTVTGLTNASITMGAGSTILRQSAIDSTFLGKIAATSNAFTIIQTNASTSNALNLTNFPNASLATWDNAGTGTFAFTGSITAGSNGYRFGSTRAGNIINITAANVLSGTAGLQLITGSLGNLNISNSNSFTGNTINNATGKTITLANNTAIQNSAIDTAGAGTYIVSVTTPTIGGLIGSKNLLTNVFAATGYNALTALTLNPGTGVTNTYSGVIANATAALAINKSGAGTQILSGVNTYAGNVTVSGGILVGAVAGTGGNSAFGSVVSTRTLNITTGGTLRFDVGNLFNNNFASASTSLPALSVNAATVTNGGTATNNALGDITLTGGTLTATVGSPAGGANSGEGYGSWNLNGTVTSTGTSIISSTAAIGIPITLSAAAGTNTIFNVTSGTLTASAPLGQVTRVGDERISSLTKFGAGTMILSGANTYSGLTTVSAGGGSLTVQNASALGTTALGTVVNGTGTGAASNARVDLAGGVTISGEALTISGVGNFLGALSSTSGTNEWAGPVTIGLVGTRLGAATASTLKVSGVIDSGVINTGLVIRTNDPTGVVVLSGANTYIGDTQLLIGTLKLDGGDNRLPVATNFSLGNSTNVNEFDLNGRSQEIAGLAVISGATAANNSVNNSSSTLSTLTVNTAAAAPSSYAGILKGNLALTKSGADMLTLTGTNTFSGATQITAGTLTLSGTGAINNTSGIAINGSGAKFLQTSSVAGTPSITLTQGTLTGSGTVNTVNVGNGTGGILSNNDGVAGAPLTTGTLVFNGAATVNTFNSSTSAAIVTASLASDVAGFVTLNPTGVWTSGATHDLISYGGGSIGGAGYGQFVLGTISGLNSRQTGGTLGNSGTAVTLTISGDTPVWSGIGTATWTTAATNDNTGPNDWALKIANTATNFWAGDGVEFNDTYNIGAGNVAVTNTTVTITGGVAPAATIFNNSAINYTVTTSDATGITAGGITKSGTGTVTINNANTYTGGTILNAGTLQLDNASALGSSGTISLGGGTLKYGTGITADFSSRFSTLAAQAYKIDTNGNNVTFASALTSSGGALTKSGSGTLTLTAANTYTGGTTVNAASGTLQATITQTTNALGTGAVSVGSGSTLILDDQSITSVTNVPLISNVFTGAGLLKLQFAANATARNTYLPNVTGFTGTIQLSNLGTTGDKWNATNIGTVSGSLLVDAGSTFYLPSGTGASFTGGITLNGSGNSEGRGAIRLVSATFGGNIRLASSSTVNMENVAAAITGNINTSAVGAQTLTLGATGSVGGTLSGNISDGTGTITVNHATGSYTLTGNLSHTGGVNVTGGLLILSGTSNTYTGVTAISATAGRSLLVTTNSALGTTGTGNETTVGSLGQLGFSGGINYTATEKIIGSGSGNTAAQGVFLVSLRGFIQSVSGSNTFAGDIDVTAASRIGTQEGASLTLTGVITQTTGNILFRTGSVTGDFITLSNAGNSFGGDSTVFNATTGIAGNYAGVRLGVTNGLPTNLSISGFSGSGAGTALDLNGKNQSLNGLVTGGGGTLKIINQDIINTSILTLNPTADQTTTLTTILGGGGLGVINLVKGGAFKQTLAGTNTFTGTITVSAGVLQIGNGSTTGTLTATTGITNNANLTINRSDAFTQASDLGTGVAITGTGSFTQAGTGTTTLTAVNSYTGNTTVSAGILALADNAQLKFVLGATSGSNNSISGAGTLTLDGDFLIVTTAANALSSGTWTLVNNSTLTETYTANFTVVGFTDAGSNLWTKEIGGGKLYTFDEATGVLTLTSSASYATWVAGFGLTGADAFSTADPDFDGIPNAVEMVLGGNPATGMDTALLPTIELVTDPVSTPAIPAGNYLLFTYRRSAISETALLTVACETDTDLVGPWTTALDTVSGVVIQVDTNFTFTPAAPADTDRLRVYVPRGANSTLFGRLNVLVP